MPDLFSDFDICGRRHKGNRQSVRAEQSVKDRKPTQTQRIVAYLRERGMLGATCEELSIALELRYTSASARCSEMKECGWVAIAGERKTTGGDMADVLVLTSKADGGADAIRR